MMLLQRNIYSDHTYDLEKNGKIDSNTITGICVTKTTFPTNHDTLSSNARTNTS